MTLKYAALALFAGVALPAAALAQSSGTTAGNNGQQSGQQFLQKVRQDSNNEVQEALIALQRATNPAVQAYAHLLVSDHSSLLAALNAIEPNQNSSSGGSSNASPQAQSNRAQSNFSDETGSQFDKNFVQHEVQQNQQSLSAWQNEANNNSEIGAFAKIGLQQQRQHMELGQAIEAQLRKGGQTAENRR